MRSRYLLRSVFIAVLFTGVFSVHAGQCGTPGKDGVGAGINGVVNTYYPGTVTALAGATQISVGAPRGAAMLITAGDMLLVIQMQDAAINSTNTANYGDGTGTTTGSSALNNSGRYEYVVATSSVVAGVVQISGTGAGNGFNRTYTNAAATAAMGQRTFQVVRVPQYSTATMGALSAAVWNGATGGVLAIDVAGNLNFNGATASVNGLGFRGAGGRVLTGAGAGTNADIRMVSTDPANASKGEGIAGTPQFLFNGSANPVTDTTVDGYPNGSNCRGAPGNAGGGGTDGDTAGNTQNSGGGGGGNGGVGGTGGNTWNSNLAIGGVGGTYLAAPPIGQLVMGGGGGAGTTNNGTSAPIVPDPGGDPGATGRYSSGANGGGIVMIRCFSASGTGTISANGSDALNVVNDGGGGGGAGGTVIVSALTGNLSNLTVSATGGKGGDANRVAAPLAQRHGPGGGGGGGVIYLTSAPLASNAGGGINGTTIVAGVAYGATPGVAGVVTTNLVPNTIPGIPSGGECKPQKLQILVPGESAAPGTVTGKTGAPTAQTAGTAFSVTVNEVDFYWNVVNTTDTVHLASTDVNAALPADAALAAGTRTFNVTLKTAGAWTLTASDVTDGTVASNTSPPITINAGAFAKLQILAPGEVASPGSVTGKTGAPTTQTAGTPFNVTVNAVDANWNLVTSTDTMRITSSDPNATLPANAPLAGGTKTFSVTPKTANATTFTASDITTPAITPNISSSITVNAGAFAKLQILAPGEVAFPGSVTGKTGAPTAQTAGTAFNVTVNAVDANWNLVTSADTMGITSSDPNATLPANAPLAGGTKTFSVAPKTANATTFTASDVTTLAILPNTSSSITVNPSAFAKLQILAPGEVASPGNVTGKTGAPTAQTAGTAFNVTVNAVDANFNRVASTDTVGITSTDVNAGLPANAALVAGTNVFSVMLRTAGTWTVTATDTADGSKGASTTGNIQVNPAAFIFSKLQILLPGETAAPGTPSGKSSTPIVQIAGTPFTVTVNAVDANWNLVNTVTDSVAITSTDANAALPANAALAAGTRTFSVTLKTAGTFTVTATDATDNTKAANTSSPVTVNPGAFAKLQILVPGETAALGTASGKTGTPTALTAGIAFNVTINAVDANWNLISAAGDTIAITSSDAAAVLPANAALAAGTKVFAVTLKTAGTATVTASDATDPTKTPMTTSALTVNPGANPPSFRFLTQQLPGGSTGLPYRFQIVTANAPAATTYSISAGVLPAGLSLDPNSGMITGVPLTPTNGPLPLTISANSGVTIALSTSIAINTGGGGGSSGTVAITTGSLPDAKVGVDYSTVITTSSGIGPFIYGADGLPPGLNMDGATGTIFGNPTTGGTYFVTLTVIDPNSNNSKTTVTLPLSVTPADSGFKFTTQQITGGQVGTPYIATVIAQNPPGAVIFTAIGMPPGLTIEPLSGIISGTPAPNTAGTYTPLITATSGTGSISIQPTLIIAPTALSDFYFITNPLPSALVGVDYGSGAAVSMVTQNPAPGAAVLTATGLPDGIVFDPKTGSFGGVTFDPGVFPITITAVDPVTGQQISVTLSFIVLPPGGGDTNNLPNNFWISKQTLKKVKQGKKPKPNADVWQAQYIYNALRIPIKRFAPQTDPLQIKLWTLPLIDITPPARALLGKKWSYTFKSGKNDLPQLLVQVDQSKQMIKFVAKKENIAGTVGGVYSNVLTLGKKTFNMDALFDPKGQFPPAAGHRRAAFVVTTAKINIKKGVNKDIAAIGMLLSDPAFALPPAGPVPPSTTPPAKPGKPVPPATPNLRVRLFAGSTPIFDKNITALAAVAVKTDTKTNTNNYKIKSLKDKSATNVLAGFSLDTRSGKMQVSLKNLSLSNVLAPASLTGTPIGVEITVGKKAYYTSITMFSKKNGAYTTTIP